MNSTFGTSTRLECSSRKRITFLTTEYMKAEPKEPGKRRALGAHQVDVGLAVDLRPAEEEDIDAPLPGEVEELARALRERIAPALVQEGKAQFAPFLLEEQRPGGGDRRRGADGDVARLADQARDHAGE